MTRKLPIPSKDELEGLYRETGATLSSLARQYETSHPTIRKWLKHHEIPIKTHLQASREANSLKQVDVPDREEFERDWEELTVVDIRKKYNTGQETVYRWQALFGLPDRDPIEAFRKGKARQYSEIIPTAEEFQALYDEHKNLYRVADEIGCSYSHVRSLVRRYETETEMPWRSIGEIRLAEFVMDIDPEGEWEVNNKSLINPFELDMVSHKRKLAIEYCGLYWHSETWADKKSNYHVKKNDLCKDKGYQLLTIFESDPQSKVQSLIKRIVGKVNRIYARKTVFHPIEASQARLFHDAHHLSGSVGANKHFGLFYRNELVMVLSMGKPRFGFMHDWECVRMTSHSDYQVIGGASKLFKHFSEIYPGDSIITFADLRFGEGLVYDHCGFERVKNTYPNYWYFHKDKPYQLYSRVKFQKHKLPDLLDFFDPDLTEYQNMTANGYGRIWDCGNAVYHK